MKLLLIEDEPAMCRALAHGFSEAGHDCVVASDCRSGLARVDLEPFEMITLDLMLSDGSGLELLRQLRAIGNETPVILLTGRCEIDDRIAGLKAGADDCLVKPFAFVELLARAEAILRRTHSRSQPLTLQVGELRLDIPSRRALSPAGTVELTQTEFRMLECLMRFHGNVVTRETLSERVWNCAWDPSTNVVDVHIARLRRKLDRHRIDSYIQTVWGQGYAIRA
jgi:DNA-binding response OmpR family regulator